MASRTVSQSQVESNLRKQVERLRARVIELQKELKPHSKGPRTYGSAMRRLQATEHKLRQEQEANKSLSRAYHHECDLNRQQRHRIESLFEELQEATRRAEHTNDRLIMANGEIDRLREAITSVSRIASVVGDANRDGRPHGADKPYPRRLRSAEGSGWAGHALTPVPGEQLDRQIDEAAGERDLRYPSAFVCTGDDVREEGF